MRQTSWTAKWAVLTAAGASLAGCAGQDGQRPEFTVDRASWDSPTGGSGSRMLSDHFDIRTTSRDEILLEYVTPFMETAYAEYERLMPRPQQSDDRLVVYLFGSRDEWAAYTQMAYPAQAHAYLHIHHGGYTDNASATAVTFDIKRDYTLMLLAHEGYHQYVAARCPWDIPPWLNEGMATQFEGFDLDGPHPVFVPRRNLARLRDLRSAMQGEQDLIPLRELLVINAGHAVTQQTRPAPTYYSQVWSLILMLREDPSGKYAQGFARLLAEAGTDQMQITLGGYLATTPGAGNLDPGEAIFRCYITEDLDAFWSEYLEFARRLVRG